eukprot:TRINITY_DN5124_c0_g1_i2.p1 TRINITY_DN5124_c0_g1~~TRINITY_DN5124_c0_g1_i2.p1  ORF type:complete len:180 (-),score=20.89 TRINITY_DN5124_c0_g1_i2:55-594(-)
MRYAGMMLMVVMDYSNLVSFDLNTVEYTISTRVVRDTEFKAIETIYVHFPTHIIERDRHGVRMLFLQTGNLGAFDFQVLLLNCVSGLGLLAVATVIVDILATMILPQRNIYYKYKYDETFGFSDYREGKIQPQEDQTIAHKFRPKRPRLNRPPSEIYGSVPIVMNDEKENPIDIEEVQE